MNDLLGTVRYTVRQFRHSPVFAATAILTLALGIGGTTAIFTLMHAVMLQALPVSDPASLYRIGEGRDCCVEGGPQGRWGMFSYPLFERLKAQAPEFEELAAFQAGQGTIGVRREGANAVAKPMRTEYVTGNYFSTFGIGALGGRVITPNDDRPSAPPVIVLSHQAWQTEYGSDPAVIGSVFYLDGHPFTVAGVTPAGFFGETLQSDPPDIWIPIQQEPMLAGDGALLHQSIGAWLRVIGRLKPGATIDGMAPRLTNVLRRWMQYEAGYPSNWMPDLIRELPKQQVAVVPAGAGVAVMKEDYSRSLQILLAVCGMVLLIACANVANLLLARGVSRRAQTALRLSVGASRQQIMLQSLLESVLLAVAGGIAGLLVAIGAARLLLLVAFQSAHFLPISTIPSPLVLAGSFGLALVTAVVFGAAPAWFAMRTDPVEALRGVGRSTADHSGFARKALLVVQAALSVVLVAGASMLVRSLNKIEHQNFGYQTHGRIVVSINRPPANYPLPKLEALYRRMQASMDALPGVKGSGMALYNPLTDNWGELILVSGHPAKISDEAGASWDRVSAHYLEGFGMTMVRGRYFNDADNENSAPVAIVNEAFVKRFFKTGEDPIGQHFGLDMPENAGTFQIVGIVHDAKFAGWGLSGPARPMFYAPLAQSVDYKEALMKRVDIQSHFIGGLMLVTDSEPGIIEGALKRELSAIDPNLTINSVRTMEKQVAMTFDQERATASLAGLFGVVALLLAAIGLYGVTAYTVARRTNEIGIRMALGADRAAIVKSVLSGAFLRVAIGLGLGLPLAVVAGKLISSQLYGVEFWDPVALGVAAGSLAICAFAAALVPASFAASISPMQALRSE